MPHGTHNLVGIVLLASSVLCYGQTRPSVGAIRWDAWTGGHITEQVERSLGPAKYHNRLPWFAEVADYDGGGVRIDGGRQSIMDREIEWASAAGLDYWAFLVYPKDSVMSTALGQYLRSENRDRIGFCMILANTLKNAGNDWPVERDRAVALLEEPGYWRVLGNRPLVYVFAGAEPIAERFREFIGLARKRGLDPYCVYMGWNPAKDYETAKKLRFDAVSAYAKSDNPATFVELVQSVESGYWQAAAKAKVPYIPLVTTGWDKSPRKDNPVSWEQGDHPYHRQKRFTARAKPEEIAAHLRRALQFNEDHPEICKARSVIVYAWNEYDEGGWLAPTRNVGDGTADMGRLEAFRRVLCEDRWRGRADATGEELRDP